MPSRGIVRSGFGLYTNTQTYTSPLTRATQRMVLGGARWEATYTIRRMKASESLAGEWRAFLLRLQGMGVSFNAYDPDRKQPLGSALGTPLVMGGSQTGSLLITDGWNAGVSGLLLPGDYFSVNGELKMATGYVNSNGSGVASIPFEPMLRGSPPDNTPIILDNPTCAMILADDRQAMWDSDAAKVYEEKTFNAFEVFS